MVVSSNDEDKKKPSGDDKVKENSSNDEDKKKPSGDDKIKENSSSDEDKKKPSGYDKVKKTSSSDEEKEIKKWSDKELEKQLDVPKTYVIAMSLIATVTFAAGFTVPGGYIADDHPGRGTAILANEYAFKVFLVSDTFAFVFSISATFWLLLAGTSAADKHTRMRTLVSAMRCRAVASAGISTAFAMGIYATLADSYRSISIILCIIVLGAPLLVDAVPGYGIYSVLKTVGIRHHCIWPTITYGHVEKILGRSRCWLPFRALILSLLPTLLSYAIFFLLPLL